MNTVELVGKMLVTPEVRGQGGRKYAFLRLRTEEAHPTVVDIVAFGDVAVEADGVSIGDRVRVKGRIGISKNTKLTEAIGHNVWLMRVVAYEISAAPKPEEKAAKPENGELPF